MTAILAPCETTTLALRMTVVLSAGFVVNIKYSKKVANITQNSPFRELCLDAESAMVTPRRAVMNYLKQVLEFMPVMVGWNGEVARFLKRPRGVQTLAVTY